MTTTAEFRQFAEECLSFTEQATTDQERKAFLDMARAWTQGAFGRGGPAPSTMRQGDKASH